MRILFLSDLHEEGIPKEYKSKLNTYDLIVSLGDNTYEDLLPLKYIDIPKIGIYGNHYRIKEDEKDWFEELGIDNIHFKKVEVQGLYFFGFDGDIKYIFAEFLKKSEGLDSVRKELNKLSHYKVKHIDFLISHLPALDVLDEPNDTIHKGLSSINSFIDNNSPKYHFFGHMHQSADIINEKTQTYCVYKALEVLI